MGRRTGRLRPVVYQFLVYSNIIPCNTTYSAEPLTFFAVLSVQCTTSCLSVMLLSHFLQYLCGESENKSHSFKAVDTVIQYL